jgi:hypothetical protein
LIWLRSYPHLHILRSAKIKMQNVKLRKSFAKGGLLNFDFLFLIFEFIPPKAGLQASW